MPCIAMSLLDLIGGAEQHQLSTAQNGWESKLRMLCQITLRAMVYTMNIVYVIYTMVIAFTIAIWYTYCTYCGYGLFYNYSIYRKELDIIMVHTIRSIFRRLTLNHEKYWIIPSFRWKSCLQLNQIIRATTTKFK